MIAGKFYSHLFSKTGVNELRLKRAFLSVCVMFFGFSAIATTTFSYTGGQQTYTVPAGVTSLGIDAIGGAGGYPYWNCGLGTSVANGGRVQCTLAVTPGQVLYIYVGGAGGSEVCNNCGGQPGGFNGGQNSNICSGASGGATDIRLSPGTISGTLVTPYTSTNRIVVAGAGGGGADYYGVGGAGGGLTGGTGTVGSCGGVGGTGGTQVNGGSNGTSGTLGVGGANGWGGGSGNLGDGGGGYWGGATGTGTCGGGGGGSSYTDPGLCTSVIHTQGYSGATGNGQLTITILNSPPAFVNGSTQSLTVCMNSSGASINSNMAISDADVSQTETWTVTSAPTHGTLAGVASYTATSTGGTITPTGMSYTPTGGYVGSDAFVVQVSDGAATATTTVNVTVAALPDVSVFSTSATNVCQGNGSSVTINSTSLVAGTYNVTYNLTGANSATGVIGSVTMASNTGTFLTSSLANAGGTTIQITSMTNASGCSSAVTSGGIVGITVNANPGAIFVPSPGSVCVGSTITLTDGTLGGTWTSSNTGLATVGSASGTVLGISGGTPTIIYTLGSGCFVTAIVTVNPTPNGITGANTVCTGFTSALTETSAGGTWSSSNPGVGSVSTGGVVAGITAGTPVISYMFAAGSCFVIFPMSVNATPPGNTGTPNVCVGSTTTLANGIGGGTWSSSNTGVGSVGAGSGVVSGISAGNPTISYTLSTGCFALTPISVNASPSSISGANNVCIGSNTTLTNSVGGGTWTSSNTALGTVGSSTGIVTGIAVGSPFISYTLQPGNCAAVQPMTVNSNPAAIGGATFTICTGSTITLTDATGGGTWSSSNGAIGSVGAGTGIVTGNSAGIVNIVYTMGTSCFVTQAVTVNTTPNPISGSNTVCLGSNTTLSSATGGGTWSSSNTAVGSVGSTTGVVTGVSNGTMTITYTTPNACFVLQPMTVNPNPSAIGGTFTVCTGTTTTLTDATAGGTWTSSNPALGTIGAASGVLGGIASGNPTITYTMGTGCFATQQVTVNPSPAAIGGTFAVCTGASTTLTDATSGGTWASSSTGQATIGSSTGTVNGVSAGTPTITYTAPNACIATQQITVNSTPASIAGSGTVCTGATTVLTDVTSGGTWSSSDVTKGTVGAGSGVVGGIAAGTTNISYTLGTGCYSTTVITVNPTPVAIAGTTNVCVGFTTTLSDGIGGGTWSSSNTALGTVGSVSGIVSGIASGVPTISYILPTGCFATTPVTVNPNPAAIGGSPVVCIGLSTTLTDATSGGVWSSSDVSKGSIVAVSGLMTGIATGNPNMTYTLPTGCYSFVAATINPNPAGITGTTNVCIGFNTTLADATTGGTWSSSNLAIGTVGSASGIVSGIASGVVTITYTLATGCIATTSVTVNSNPAAITGTGTVCVSSTTPLFDATGSGTWSTSNGALAGVGAGSGVVNGVSAGNPIITYTLGTGCFATTIVTVNPLPAAITGTVNVCVGLTTTLADATTGGTWSSSNTAEGTIGSASAVVGGISAGVPTMTYTLPTGCIATTPVTVNPNPTVLTGTATVCTGATTTLASTPTGGVWSSSNVGQGTAGAGTGVVGGIAVGNPVITYTLPTGCLNTRIVTVNQTPVSIAGTLTVCVGTTTTLTDATVGGNWSSSNTSQATIGSASGLATGLAAGIPIISYTMATGCFATAPLTVNTLPANITGANQVCTGATIGLSDATAGGTWSSSNTTWATVNSTSGVVTGQAAGSPNITYLLPTGCFAIYPVTVNQTPAGITGTLTVCTGLTTTLADGTTGGNWSSSNTGIASIGSSSGVVTGNATGTATISYAMPAGCYVVTTVTVNQTPVAITGTMAVCVGSTTTLSDATSGGTWTSSNPGQGTVGSATGVVGGITPGTPTITYTMPTGCLATTVVTVNLTPAAITGTLVVCAGLTTTLSDGTSGGTWTSGNTGIATVGSSSGVVTGVAAGVCGITYSTGAGCFAAVTYTVNPIPNISNFTSTTATSPCVGGSSTVTISSTSLGIGTFTVTYNLSGANSVTGATATLTMGASNGTFTIPSASLAGSGSTTVTVTGISNSFGCISNPGSGNTATFAVNTLPTVYNVIGGGSYCAGGSGVHIYLSNSVGGINYQLMLGASPVGTPVAGTFSGLDFGLITALGTYTVTATNTTTGCTIAMAGSATISTTPVPNQFAVNGGGSYCAGGTGVLVGLASSNSGINYQLYVGGSATGSPAGGTGAAISFGLQTAAGTYTVVATDATSGCTNSMTGSATVVINPLPSAISGTLFVCPGTTSTLTDASAGGTWSSSTPATGSIGSTTGVLAGITAGTTIITYTLGTGCIITATATVNPNPASISGPTGVCAGSAITLTDATGGGNWTSSNTSLATVNISTGVVNGVATGTPTITYTLSTGCLTVFPVTVNPQPAGITGTTNVCTTLTATLADATAGGTWSSSAPAIGSIGSATGIVAGLTAGTTTITYTLPAGCFSTTAFTVNQTPGAITGTTNVCFGLNTTLTDASSGGTWSSSNSGIANINAISGNVAGAGVGIATITYTLPAGGCFVTAPFTVNPMPASITGVNTVCIGFTSTLGDATSGGTWTSSNPAVGTVGAATGIVGGITAGNINITYTLAAGSCNVIFPMTVNPNPAVITGTTNVCVGSTTTLSDGTTGGTWSSSNPALGSVGAGTGIVAGLATGTPIISYTLGTGCFATTPVTVNPLPAAITGVTNVCVGLTTTLSDASSGGTWTSSVPTTGSVGAGSGVVTGVNAGNINITYTLPTGCLVTTPFTVNPTPAGISGSPFVCVGLTTTLSDATSGGTWSSSNPALGSVGSTTGIVAGLAIGVPTITYTLPAGCFATMAESVNTQPPAITGTLTVCAGLTTTLSDAVGGGTWSSSNTAVGSVIATTGVVTGVSAGNATISYTLPGGCFVTTTITVNPSPASIAGSNNVCSGLTTTLTDAVSGGVWASSASGVASIGTSGIVTGSSAGTATITYTLPAGCFTTLPFTVNPLPAGITGIGPLAVCLGKNDTLFDATSGGSWSSSNTSVATIGSSTGIGTGVSVGTVIITYTLPTGCIATTSLTVNPLPTIFTMTGGGTYCAGGTGAVVGLSGSQSGVNYQLFLGASPVTGGIVSGTGSAISFGLQTGAGTYTAIATNTTTGCINTMSSTSTVTVTVLPTVFNMTGGGGYCAGGAGVLVGLNNSQSGVNYQLYNSFGPIGSPIVVTTGGSAISWGLITGAGTYTVVATNAVTGCVSNMAGASVVTVFPNPIAYTVTGGGSYCTGTSGVTIGLSNSTSGVNYTVTNGTVSATLAGTGTSLNFGLFTSVGTYTVNATNATTGCTNTMLGTATVTLNTLPTNTFLVTGGGAYCAGLSGMTVGLNGSQSGVNYQLYVGGSPTGSPVAGTGGTISFGLQTTAGTYTVVATNATTGCTSTMTSSVVITINPLPAVFAVTGGGAYCAGGTGVPIGVNNSVVGYTYNLIRSGSSVATFFGTGSAFNFGSLMTVAGIYTVTSTNTLTGCVSTMSGSAVVSISSLPVLYSVTGGGSYCAGGTGLSIGLSNSDAGINYQLMLAGSTVGLPVAGTGSAITFGTTYTVGGTYTVVATNPLTGCTNTMSSFALITVNPLPALFTVTGGGSYCAGGAGDTIGLSGSVSGFNYQLMLAGVPVGLPVLGTGSSINFGFLTGAGIYTVVATNIATGCTRPMTGTVVISINPLPPVNNVTGGGSYCAGGTGVPVGIDGSATGINYQLFNTDEGILIGAPVAGSGSAISFGLITVSSIDTYTVIATSTLTGCSVNMNGSAIINPTPLPTIYSVTGGGGYCTGGTGSNVGLSNSDLGISYQLMYSGSPLGAPVTGTGSAISFGSQTGAGIYTVVATNSTTGCTNNMSGSVAITINPLPASFVVTGGGNYCPGGSGVNIGLANSTSGVNYQLYLGIGAVGTPVAGSGTTISFGLQTAVGTYSVVAIDGTTGCTRLMTGTAVVGLNPLPAAFTVTGGGGYCTGGAGAVVGLSGSTSGINYQLVHGVTLTGIPMAGTGSALNFGLQTLTGTYTVIATNAITGCSSNMTGTVTVSLNPLPTAYTVTGGGGYCTGGTGVLVGLSGSNTTISYQLYQDGVALGTPLAGTGSSISFGLQTAAATYTIVATNSVTGCTNNMTGSATVMINLLPNIYAVTGGGSYCAGGTGVHIGTSTSDPGINYQLMMSSSPVGGPVAGTGAPLDFGLFTIAGTYSVVATNALTGCVSTMSGSAVVVINPLPVVYSLTGGGSYCAGGAGILVGLSGSQFGINYQLYNGAPAGSPVPGSGSAISFGLMTAGGTYTVVATNASTLCTSNMTGSAAVIVNPLPIIDTVTGGGNYCPGGSGVHVGLTSSTTGVNYQLMRGSTMVGAPLAGTGSGLDFGSQTIVGTYFVVATNPATGCTSNMSGSAAVNISALPTAFNVGVSASGYCAGGSGVHVTLSGSSTGVQYQLYLAGLPVGSPWPGTGFPIDFGLYTSPGIYTVVATDGTTGCVNNMTGAPAITINLLPTIYTVTGGGSYCAGSTGVSVLLSGSEMGVNYQLMNGSTSIGSPMAGTAFSLNFGPQTLAGVYTVVATNTTTGCSSTMLSSASIAVNPLPAIHFVTGGGSYCAGTAGVHIGVNTTDVGINYQLFLGGSAVGSPIPGAPAGAPIDFGSQTIAGTYTVVATNVTTGCTSTMTGSAIVAINPAPTAYAVVGGGNICAGGTGVHVGLGGSASGTTYQLLLSGVATGTPVAGTGSAIDFGIQTAGGTYTVMATNTATGCTGLMTGSVVITVSPLPTVYNVTGGGSYCASTAGVNVSLGNSDIGVNYQLYNGGSVVGGPLSGVGGVLNFGLQPAGVYTVVAVNATTGCTSNMSGSVTVTVIPTVVPGVTISTGVGDTVCAGTMVTFTALPTNGGSLPTYQWAVNGVPAGTTSNTYSYIPTNGNVVSVIMTSNATCVLPATATDAITMTVKNNVTPMVSIAPSPNDTVCQGTVVTFTPTAVWGGTSPTFTWFVNGVNSGISSTYSYSPMTGDIVFATMNSSYACVLSPTALSNNVTMHVEDNITPAVTVMLNQGMSVGGVVYNDTFTAVVTNGGFAPAYQWSVNGAQVTGANGATYIAASLNNNDAVSCVVSKTNSCGTLSGSNYVIILSTNVGVHPVTVVPSDIRLVPNPNKGIFTLKGNLGTTDDQEASLEVTDMLGQVVYHGKVIVRGGIIDETIQMINVANGMYLLNLHAGAENKVFHMVVEQ